MWFPIEWTGNIMYRKRQLQTSRVLMCSYMLPFFQLNAQFDRAVLPLCRCVCDISLRSYIYVYVLGCSVRVYAHIMCEPNIIMPHRWSLGRGYGTAGHIREGAFFLGISSLLTTIVGTTNWSDHTVHDQQTTDRSLCHYYRLYCLIVTCPGERYGYGTQQNIHIGHFGYLIFVMLAVM